MQFVSFAFILFFPVVLFFAYLLPANKRWLWLLAASLFFYMWWQPVYVVLLLTSILLSYGTALALDASPSPSRKKAWLALSIIGNLAILFAFKYVTFAAETLQHLSGWSLTLWKVTLPMGISFYTFQTLSYTIDVYRKATSPTRHLGHYALYISLFPQLVAGPIERAQTILPQITHPKPFSYDNVASGLRLMLWGFFQKIFIADRLALFVNSVYNAPASHNSPALLTATVFFSFQILCDFAGYTWIAIGAARCLNIQLSQNFRQPYFAHSIADFWRRWHITLSSWFRDYVYISLGGRRVSLSRYAFNLAIVFLLSGLWHGAKWTFVIWGALHGAWMLIGHLTKPARTWLLAAMRLDARAWPLRLIRILWTFSLVCFGWIFFRADDMLRATHIASHLFDDLGWPAWRTFLQKHLHADFVLSCLCIFALLVVHALQSRTSIERTIAQWHPVARWTLYLATSCAILFWGAFQKQPFIYFQF